MDVQGQAPGVIKRRYEVLAWSVFALCIALALGAAILGSLATASKDVQQFGAENWIGQLAFVLPLLSLPFIGGFLAGRVPRNPIGWLLLASGLCWMTTAFHDAYLAYGEHLIHRPPPFVDYLALTGWVPGVTLITVFTLLLFPNGTLPSRRWRPVFWTAIIALATATLITDITPNAPNQPLVGIPPILHPLEHIAAKLGFVPVLIPLFLLVAGASLIVRFRRAAADDRAKLKWIAFGGLVAVIYFAFTVGMSVFFDKPGNPLGTFVHVLQSGVFFALAAIPITIGFAVLRYRLYEIDRIISRTLSYAGVSIVLAAVYVGVVLLPTSVLGSGHAAPPWLVAAGTLVVAVLFSPVRTKLQGAVDHRFNRRRYDAARVLEEFGIRLREHIDLDELRPALEDVIERTMQPATVRLWLAP